MKTQPKENRFCIWESKDLEDLVAFTISITGKSKRVDLSVSWSHRGHVHVIDFKNLGTLEAFSEDYIWAYGTPGPPEPTPTNGKRIKALLSEAIADRKKEVQEALKRPKASVVVDFSALRDKLMEQGISLQSVKCPSCGGTIALPTAGAKKTCEYCGSHIYAMQVMLRQQ